MSLYDFFLTMVGVSSAEPVTFCLLSFMTIFIVIDFIHVFFTAVFSLFKK